MKHLIFTLVFVVVSATSIFSAERDLLRTESGLHEKLIVTDNNAYCRDKPEMQGKAESTSAFSIFWRLKTNTLDNEQNGYYRIGGPDGNQIGWIEKKFVTPWRTRFCLDPMLPQPDRFFSVKNNETKLKFTGQNGQIPSGHKRFALITKSADNENEEAELDVVVFTGEVKAEGGIGGEKMAIANMELEVVFVIDTTMSMEPMIEMVKEITQKTADSLAKNDNIKDIVHFGLVEYRDTDKDSGFTARTVCGLRAGFSKFSTALKELKCEGGGDTPEEALLGLREAVKNAGWINNSSKHIILLGDAPIKDKNLSIADTKFPSSSNLTLENVINITRPQFGRDDQRSWFAKNLHTISNKPEPQADVLRKKLTKDGLSEAITDKFIKMLSSPELQKAVLADPEKFLKFLIEVKELDEDFAFFISLLVFSLAAEKEINQATARQFTQLAQNQEQFQGFYESVNTWTNDGSKERAINGLIQALEESFRSLEKARIGKADDVKPTSGSTGVISQSIYQIISTNAPPDRFKDKSTFAGVAKSRDENGRLVAEKKIMVMKDELRSFRSSMDLLYTQFKSKSNKAQRQNVSDILKTMTESIVSVASGEKEIDEGMKLDKILAFEFPLKTPALNVSARDIAVMTTEAFNSWLEQLKTGSERASQLLETPENWTKLNNHLKQEFTFLKLSELP
jgi:hypothetical protein